MSTSAIDKHRSGMKTVFVYLAAAVLCLFFNSVYALFGHGVRSGSMTQMFLYPLIGGALVFWMLRFLPNLGYSANYRLFFNCHNAGIATLVAFSLMTGVFETAGTASDEPLIFSIAGWALIGIGFLALLLGSIKKAANPIR